MVSTDSLLTGANSYTALCYLQINRCHFDRPALFSYLQQTVFHVCGKSVARVCKVSNGRILKHDERSKTVLPQIQAVGTLFSAQRENNNSNNLNCSWKFLVENFCSGTWSVVGVSLLLCWNQMPFLHQNVCHIVTVIAAVKFNSKGKMLNFKRVASILSKREGTKEGNFFGHT